MFTNNYIAYREMMCMGATAVNFVDVTGATVSGGWHYAGCFDIGNVAKYGRCRAVQSEAAGTSAYNLTSNINPGVYFGSGATPAQKGDYKLEAPIESGLSIVSPTAVGVSSAGGKHSLTSPIIVRNTSESEVIIREVGLYSSVVKVSLGGSPSNSTKWPTVLFERTVLAEPITLAPGEAKVVTYEVVFNQS